MPTFTRVWSVSSVSHQLADKIRYTRRRPCLAKGRILQANGDVFAPFANETLPRADDEGHRGRRNPRRRAPDPPPGKALGHGPERCRRRRGSRATALVSPHPARQRPRRGGDLPAGQRLRYRFPARVSALHSRFPGLAGLAGLGRLQAYRFKLVEFEWDSSAPLAAREHGAQHRLRTRAARSWLFYRIHLRVVWRLQAGRRAVLRGYREVATTGGEMPIPLWFPTSGRLDMTGWLTVRDVFGLTRAQIRAPERRRLLVPPDCSATSPRRRWRLPPATTLRSVPRRRTKSSTSCASTYPATA